MLIVQYGKVKPKQCICKECDATLEYTPFDVRVHSNLFHTYYYVTCPICGNWRFVNEKGDSE